MWLSICKCDSVRASACKCVHVSTFISKSTFFGGYGLIQCSKKQRGQRDQISVSGIAHCPQLVLWVNHDFMSTRSSVIPVGSSLHLICTTATYACHVQSRHSSEACAPLVTLQNNKTGAKVGANAATLSPRLVLLTSFWCRPN